MTDDPTVAEEVADALGMTVDEVNSTACVPDEVLLATKTSVPCETCKFPIRPQDEGICSRCGEEQ